MTPKVPPREGTRPTTTPCRPGTLTRHRGFMSSCIIPVCRRQMSLVTSAPVKSGGFERARLSELLEGGQGRLRRGEREKTLRRKRALCFVVYPADCCVIRRSQVLSPGNSYTICRAPDAAARSCYSPRA